MGLDIIFLELFMIVVSAQEFGLLSGRDDVQCLVPIPQTGKVSLHWLSFPKKPRAKR